MNRRQFAATLSAATPLLLPRVSQAASVRWPASGIAPLGRATREAIPSFMEIASLPGLAIGEVQHGRPTDAYYFGVADTGTNSAISAQTLFSAASLGKPVFAWAVLQLSDQGRLDLDRPLFEYLTPADRPADERVLRVTARHVLSHTSGFRNWRQQVNEPFASAFEPGTRFLYSGEGYYLLQRVVERITDSGIEPFMRQCMDGLGMRESTFLWRADALERLAHGHSVFRNNEPTRDYFTLNAKVFERMQASGLPATAWRHEQTLETARQLGRDITPQSLRPNVASGLLTTIRDYTAFLSRLIGPMGDAADLKPATHAAMRSAYARVNARQSWGLGIGLESVATGAAPEYLWQWGDNGGGIWKNFALVHPSSASGIVLFSNGTYGMHVIERVVRVATGRDLASFLWVG
jgi:CubicO group peptidase (beta-lactamase class C family)